MQVYAFEPEGSSPLARGLPQKRTRRGRGNRIIPARAGFTPPHTMAEPPAQDHPRSRGVYSSRQFGPSERSGSSPLARGLPHALLMHRGARGIIPARAGFTRRPGRRVLHGGDHPRSRGVYDALPSSMAASAGSSPLARGLPKIVEHDPAGTGIIPARAGFTQAIPAQRIVKEGSSPLARGLQGGVPAHGETQRIIPARAGFTLPARQPGEPHPGSSPLARGLRDAPFWEVRTDRIIPARAGFTTTCAGPPTPWRDHPRSRGVYRTRGWRAPAGAGIIPARAGFTRDPAPPAGRAEDHPRSRGVYVSCMWPTRRPRGSSPLARGLPRRGGSPGGPPWIIPARAGFTLPEGLRLGGHGDHPRSRGVYFINDNWNIIAQGSSPLARGLLRPRCQGLVRRGIIPARAGFTGGRRRGS